VAGKFLAVGRVPPKEGPLTEKEAADFSREAYFTGLTSPNHQYL
jgi:hypothetical protein